MFECISSLLPLSLLASFLPFSLLFSLPSLLSCSFLSWFLAWFLDSLLPSFLPFRLPSFFPSFLSAFFFPSFLLYPLISSLDLSFTRCFFSSFVSLLGPSCDLSLFLFYFSSSFLLSCLISFLCSFVTFFVPFFNPSLRFAIFLMVHFSSALLIMINYRLNFIVLFEVTFFFSNRSMLMPQMSYFQRRVQSWERFQATQCSQIEWIRPQLGSWCCASQQWLAQLIESCKSISDTYIKRFGNYCCLDLLQFGFEIVNW